ncbi:MAG TPA: WecB/TagA/CpsF family glycosyltransferase [Puia sp.]|nr:WecB/TagA/CpsF family glycosyltransferase [Puia sp.]
MATSTTYNFSSHETEKTPGAALLLRRLKLVPDELELSKIFALIDPRKLTKPTRIAFVNAHGFNLCYRNKTFLQHLVDCDFVFRDGSGMKILCKMLGADPGLNLNGTDLIPRIINLYGGKNAALLGTSAPYLQRAAREFERKGVNPAVVMDGFHDDEEYLKAVQDRKLSLIVLAMGMPKQERIAALLARNLRHPCLIVCGGAILDFIGGKVRRAPMIFRKLGIEWLYRLAQEPKRLFRRYVIGNAVFLGRCAVLALSTAYLTK